MAGPPDPRLLALVDQMVAAQRDIEDLIGWVSPDRQGWRKVDAGTAVRVDGLLSGALAEHGRSARICPHAWASILGDAPKPQVLDADRGILACLEGCYLLVVATTVTDPGAAPAPVVRCFDCGRALGRHPLDNLLIGYGPVLIVGSLCDRCDRDWLPAPRGVPDGS